MEDSNDKSSARLQRRVFRRRLNYASLILFMSLSCYALLLMNMNKKNNSRGNMANTKEWKIKRALDMMKHRENNNYHYDVDNAIMTSDNNINEGHTNRHHDAEREEEMRHAEQMKAHHLDNRNEYFGVRGGGTPRDDNNNRYNPHQHRHPHERMNNPRMRNHDYHPKFNAFDHSSSGGGNERRNPRMHDNNRYYYGRVTTNENNYERTPTTTPITFNATHPYKWVNAKILPKIPSKKTTEEEEDDKTQSMLHDALENMHRGGHNRADFKIRYEDEKEEHKSWEEEMKYYDNLNDDNLKVERKVDYRTDIKYVYPQVIMSPPEQGGYPQLISLTSVLKEWPQDDIDLLSKAKEMKEVLLHFDYSNITERNAAIKFRDKELPFKVYNVPEINAATSKWTDEYVSQEFEYSYQGKTAKGHCQQSDNNYFAFFRNNHWNVDSMGSPPTMDNDWTYRKWTMHAKYADLKAIPFYHRHYYWQAGAQHDEIHQRSSSQQSFISSDLPSFSSNENNFFSFHTDDQKGIQCRFGERGVTAATHYDAGRNMIAMIKGSKRYILSPPKSCSKLGIVNEMKHPVFRHSLLNFAHINLSKEQTNGMSNEERQWLQRAATAPSLSTVLNEGEVLYIPSHWFHYIISLQKSAQCNVRSGRDVKGSKEFGGLNDVEECVDIDDDDNDNDNNAHDSKAIHDEKLLQKYLYDGGNTHNNHY